MSIDLSLPTESAIARHLMVTPNIDRTEQPHTTCHYFVDEAGDAALFNRNGRVIVGNEGCSHFFILGVLKVAHPDLLANDIKQLRADFMADSYFGRVPSMQKERGKTSAFFHANDDIPEVRWQMFQLLRKHNLQFRATVRNKIATVNYVRQRNAEDSTYRYQPNDLYNDLTRRLFHGQLHKDNAYQVCFARRGKSDQTRALQSALSDVQISCNANFGIVRNARLDVTASRPADFAGLQAVDYFLWALQRLYERREERYFEYLAPQICHVRDLDDTRLRRYGEHYHKKRPLSLAALQELPGI